MKLVDNLIVTLALFVLRGVMAVGTGLVYAQFFALILAGITTLVVLAIHH
jgi:hypothetical protein